MDKRIFSNVQNMIQKEMVNSLRNTDMTLQDLCDCYGVTVSEYYEFINELALIGFKEKYNQHNHPENNRVE